MIALVLSGGSNYGAMQAGALAALIEHGIKPDIIIGTSAGAMNGAIIAHEFSAESTARLADLWRNITTEIVYPGSYPAALWRLAKGEIGLFANSELREYISRQLPMGVTTFGNLTAARFYVIATEIPSGILHIFGEDPADNLLDAILASAALPPLYPPYPIGDKFYVDGSLAAKFPLKIAVEKGATTIYALHIYHNPAEKPYEQGIISVARWSIAKLLHDQDEMELAQAKTALGRKLHYIQLKSPLALSALDFSFSAELISDGYAQTKTYLNTLPLPVAVRAKNKLKALKFQLSTTPQTIKTSAQHFFHPSSSTHPDTDIPDL